MIWTVPILLGIESAGATAVSALSGDDDATLLSTELAAMWALANLLWLYDGLQYLPALDWIVGVQAVVIATTRNEKWPRLFVLLIGARLTLHVVDYLTSHTFTVTYIHGLNATFALLVGIMFYVGGGNASRDLLGHLHRLGDRLRNSLRAPTQGLAP